MTTKVVHLLKASFDVAESYSKSVRQHHRTNQAAPKKIMEAVEAGYELCGGKRRMDESDDENVLPQKKRPRKGRKEKDVQETKVDGHGVQHRDRDGKGKGKVRAE